MSIEWSISTSLASVSSELHAPAPLVEERLTHAVADWVAAVATCVSLEIYSRMADFLGCCYRFIQFTRGRLCRDERQNHSVCVCEGTTLLDYRVVYQLGNEPLARGLEKGTRESGNCNALGHGPGCHSVSYTDKNMQDVISCWSSQILMQNQILWWITWHYLEGSPWKPSG